MIKCPMCNGEVDKIIYYGLPHKFCKDRDCNCMFGFFALFTKFLPFNGWVVEYKSNYFVALFYWVKG